MQPRASVIGLGHVGLSAATCFAHKGTHVIGLDKDQVKLDTVRKGKLPFYEQELGPMLQECLKNGTIEFTSDYKDAVEDTNLTFVCVSTPSINEQNEVDLSYVKEVLKSILAAAESKEEYHLIVLQSTVPPGTTDTILEPLISQNSKKRLGKDIGLCVSPEFLREGRAVEDTRHPDRLIIGSYNELDANTLVDFYKKIYRDDLPPLLLTNSVNAEMIKYANNAFLATKISFINSIANLCERLRGADVNIVARGIGFDKRIGEQFLNAGLGFGGSCLPKDLRGIISVSYKLGYDNDLLGTIYKVNELRADRVIELIKSFVQELKGKRIAVLGLAFKPNTDDIREAVSLRIISKLRKEDASVVVYDPEAMENAKSVLGKDDDVKYARNSLEAIKDADCAIIVTEWDEFKKITPEIFNREMREPILIDGRRIYDPSVYSKSLKFTAIGLGT